MWRIQVPLEGRGREEPRFPPLLGGVRGEPRFPPLLGGVRGDILL